MIDRYFFVSKKNYYLIYFFDKIFKVIWLLSNIFSLSNNRTDRKNRGVFIGPTHLGDILLTTPAIRFAKEKNPDLEIICIASSSSKAAIANNPHLAGVEIIDLPWFAEKKGSFIQTLLSFCQFVKVLKEINAETALNFSSTSYHREHLAMWLAGIPQRIGFSHKGFEYFLTGSPSFLRNELIAKQKLRMVGHWLGENTDHYSLKPDYFISETANKRADKLLDALGLEPGKAVIAVNPGAQHNYLWPTSHYVELSNLIYDKWKANLLFLGMKSFESLIEQIRSQLNFKTFSLVGKTSLEELAAILGKMDLLITVDTGARHIANAVGIRSVVLRHGADSVMEFGKYVATEEVLYYQVPCSPCGKITCPLGTPDCMTQITPEMVMKAVAKVLTE